MKTLPVLMLILCFSRQVFSQPIIFQDPVSTKIFDSEKYSGLKGSPFIFEKWLPGSVTTPSGVYRNLELNLDGYSNILYFQKDEKAFELTDNIIGFSVRPFPLDSLHELHFEKGLNGNGIKPGQFVQVLSRGKISLYKSDIKMLADVNEINAGVVKTFNTSSRYFIVRGNEAELIKLNAKDLAEVFEDKRQEVDAFIKERKLSLKKEKDVIEVFNYYNSI